MDRYRIRPGDSVRLDEIDTRATTTFDGGKEDSIPEFHRTRQRLAELQDVLYAQGEHRFLIVLQGMDTGGKDGTIRHVFHDVDPIGIHMRAFKRPTDRELAHDYLWRVHPHVPGNGEMVLFNRSHYEDVLVVRVHGKVSEEQVAKRFEHIRNFEQMLVDEGTTIVKIFLHISKAEQAERLQARLDDPTKRWKFSSGDLAERKHWDRYQQVYAEAIEKTSTDDAPWYVVPADRKWYRNLVVSKILVHTLDDLGMQYPPPEDGLDEIVID